MAHEWPVRLAPVAEFTSAGLASHQTRPVPQGQTWHITRVSFEGSLATSGGNTRARVHVDSGGVKLPQIEQQSPVADTLYWDDLDVDLVEGEFLVLEWDQAQVNTTLKLYVNGKARWLYERQLSAERQEAAVA